MKRFEYQAIDKDGKVVNGVIDAKNFEALLRVLFEKKLHPMSIQTLTGSGAEINRLKQLAQKIEGNEEPEPEIESMGNVKKFQTNTQEYKLDKSVNIDWAYLLYILLIVGIISLAVMAEIDRR